jgi:hypothetical protein
MKNQRKTEQTQLAELGYSYAGKNMLGNIPAEIFTKQICSELTKILTLYRNPQDKQMTIIVSELKQIACKPAAEFIWGQTPTTASADLPNTL